MKLGEKDGIVDGSARFFEDLFFNFTFLTSFIDWIVESRQATSGIEKDGVGSGIDYGPDLNLGLFLTLQLLQ